MQQFKKKEQKEREKTKMLLLHHRSWHTQIHGLGNHRSAALEGGVEREMRRVPSGSPGSSNTQLAPTGCKSPALSSDEKIKDKGT